MCPVCAHPDLDAKPGEQVSCTRYVPRQLQSLMCICCPTCCMAQRRRSGATRLSRANRGDPRGRTPGAGHDLAACEIQRRRRRSGAAQEPHQGNSALQSGVALPHPQVSLRIYQGSLSRPEEESRMATGGLRARQSLPTPQAAGPAGGVVSLVVASWPPKTQTVQINRACRVFIPAGATATIPALHRSQKRSPAQRFPSERCRSRAPVWL